MGAHLSTYKTYTVTSCIYSQISFVTAPVRCTELRLASSRDHLLCHGVAKSKAACICNVRMCDYIGSPRPRLSDSTRLSDSPARLSDSPDSVTPRLCDSVTFPREMCMCPRKHYLLISVPPNRYNLPEQISLGKFSVGQFQS